VLQCVAVCCSVLQCVAVCCSVLQCVAVCCSVLQCVAVCDMTSFCLSQVIHQHGKTCAAEIRALSDPLDPLASVDTHTHSLSHTHDEFGGCLLCVPAASSDGRLFGVLHVISTRAGARCLGREGGKGIERERETGRRG